MYQEEDQRLMAAATLVQELQEQDVWENEGQCPSLSTGGVAALHMLGRSWAYSNLRLRLRSICFSTEQAIICNLCSAGSNHVSVVMRQPGSDSSSESDYDEQLAKKV